MKNFFNNSIRFDTSEEKITDHEDRSKKLQTETKPKQSKTRTGKKKKRISKIYETSNYLIYVKLENKKRTENKKKKIEKVVVQNFSKAMTYTKPQFHEDLENLRRDN